jgi:hypothetical protein
MPTIRETVDIIESFADLPRGWRFGRGGPIGFDQRILATRLLNAAKAAELSRANAFASEDGAVLVSFYAGDYQLDITVENDNGFTIAVDRDDDQIAFVKTSDLELVFYAIWYMSPINFYLEVIP